MTRRTTPVPAATVVALSAQLDEPTGQHDGVGPDPAHVQASTGVDLVATEQMRGVLERHPEAEQGLFTPAEIRYCRSARNVHERFAARFAAKEAVLKVLGTGMAKGMDWTEIEVGRLQSGEPTLLLRGAASRRAELLGLHRWLISLSHCRGMAVAFVVALGRPSQEDATAAGQQAQHGGDALVPTIGRLV